MILQMIARSGTSHVIISLIEHAP